MVRSCPLRRHLPLNAKAPRSAGLLVPSATALSPSSSADSGGGIRTRDLRVMSPTSYLTAPPRAATYEGSGSRALASTHGRALGVRKANVFDVPGTRRAARVAGDRVRPRRLPCRAAQRGRDPGNREEDGKAGAESVPRERPGLRGAS